MSKTLFTVCVECENLILGEPHAVTGRVGIWDYLCRASKRNSGINPVTGEIEFQGVNDLGGQYFTDEEFFSCNRINICGKCRDFKKKENL